MKYDGGGLNDSSFTIMSPNDEDKGNYSCTVSNAAGSVTNSVIFGINEFYFLHGLLSIYKCCFYLISYIKI